MSMKRNLKPVPRADICTDDILQDCLTIVASEGCSWYPDEPETWNSGLTLRESFHVLSDFGFTTSKVPDPAIFIDVSQFCTTKRFPST
ncbi:hypothetical protein M0804_001016 [Polistes exclamans]|nr:hypothetical protein M0804_001016 [Polistes exclamans]